MIQSRRIFPSGVIAVLLVCVTPAVHAQLATDEVPRRRTVPRREEIRQQLEDSRWTLGALRMRPIFALQDLGYDSNVNGEADEEATGDWRGTASAGLDLLLPLGNKLYLAGTANPKYTWYRETTYRRTSGGLYRGSILALFNRLSIEAGGSTDKEVVAVSPEIERAIPNTRNHSFARAEIDIFRRLSLFGTFDNLQQRYDPSETDIAQGISLEQLERDENFARAGVRYKPRSYLDVSVAAERGHTDFTTADESDNETRAVIIGLHYDRPRFYVDLSGGSRTTEAYGPQSRFPKLTSPTGSFFAQYELGASLVLDAYGHRRVQYSVDFRNPYFLDTRHGAGVTIPVGRRIGLRAFGETGSLDYQVIKLGTQERKDDLSAAGGGISYTLFRNVVFTILASRTRYDSNLEGFDRSIFRVATSLSIQGDSF